MPRSLLKGTATAPARLRGTFANAQGSVQPRNVPGTSDVVGHSPRSSTAHLRLDMLMWTARLEATPQAGVGKR